MGTFELLWFMDDEPTPEVRRREDAEVSAENGRSGAERSPSASPGRRLKAWEGPNSGREVKTFAAMASNL